MLVREGNERTKAIDLKLAALLAGVAGALNAAGFHAAGFFTANMTGNVSALSDHLALGELAPAALFAALVIAFIFGAFCSGLLIETGRRRGVRAIYAYSILFEAMVIAALGLGELALPKEAGLTLLIVGLSFAMGVQNAATTRISDARVRTTHVSGMATDIGLNLAALPGAGADREALLARLRLHGGTLLAFLIGGIIGGIGHQAIGFWMLLAAAAVLLCIAAPQVRKARAA